MDSTTRELIAGYLAKAAQKLGVARRLLQAGDYDDCISRAYYAVFHAARALLLSAGQNPTTHHGTVTLFNMLFIKTGRIDRAVGKCLLNLKDDRETVDYELFADADSGEAGKAIEEAELFLAAAKAFLAAADQSAAASPDKR